MKNQKLIVEKKELLKNLSHYLDVVKTTEYFECEFPDYLFDESAYKKIKTTKEAHQKLSKNFHNLCDYYLKIIDKKIDLFAELFITHGSDIAKIFINHQNDLYILIEAISMDAGYGKKLFNSLIKVGIYSVTENEIDEHWDEWFNQYDYELTKIR